MEVPKSVKIQGEDEKIMKIEILMHGSKLMKIQGREDRWRRPKEWRSISVSIFPPNLLRRVIVWKALCRWKGTVQALSESQATLEAQGNMMLVWHDVMC